MSYRMVGVTYTSYKSNVATYSIDFHDVLERHPSHLLEARDYFWRQEPQENEAMKHLTIALFVVAGFCSGCAFLDTPIRQLPPVTTVAQPSSPPTTVSAKPERRPEQIQLSQQLSPSAAASNGEQPIAVIKVDPRTGKLTGEMESRLQKVVDEARQDERALLRLESFVPAGGSPGLDLSRSEKTLQIIKDRLAGSGIPLRRILVSSFGSEHDMQRDPTHHWVEIYLIRTGAAATSETTGARK